ncbi:hypothetical protein BFL28_04920 [Sphingomonas turrisvirgatae]|uniref:DUF2155 domain-containing protein n=1 Tax=Sphingomonas turrisvirgatae TaxID=1888892 RepID=A0A1E3LSI3_9SPHN|nr:hypothetical protein BFL28_04920 [Sphingomonas turrisvirgatae]
MSERARFAATLLAVLTLAGCDWVKGPPPAPKKTAADKVDVAPAGKAGEEIVTVDAGGPATAVAGTTPMAERVATLGLLNKRNGATRDVQLKPGQAMRIGDVIIRLRACDKTAPFESEQYTGAFAQVDVHGTDGKWSRAFSGWLYKERPALNVVQHPIYDVWVKNCAMTFPDTGGEAVGDEEAPARRSSAPKSAATPAPPPASPAEPSPSATDNSDR